MNLKEIGKLFTSKFVRTGPSSYKKGIYRAAVSQSLRNTGVEGTTLLEKKFNIADRLGCVGNSGVGIPNKPL